MIFWLASFSAGSHLLPVIAKSSPFFLQITSDAKLLLEWMFLKKKLTEKLVALIVSFPVCVNKCIYKCYGWWHRTTEVVFDRWGECLLSCPETYNGFWQKWTDRALWITREVKLSGLWLNEAGIEHKITPISKAWRNIQCDSHHTSFSIVWKTRRPYGPEITFPLQMRETH